MQGARQHTRLLAQQRPSSLVAVQSQSFNSMFGGIFGRKKDEPKKEETAAPAKKSVETQKEPAKYHKQTVQAKEDEDADIKQKIRELDRTGDNNLFGRYKRQRKTLKERNTNLEVHLHPSLMNHPRVSIEKFESKNFRRGLQEGE